MQDRACCLRITKIIENAGIAYAAFQTTDKGNIALKKYWAIS